MSVMATERQPEVARFIDSYKYDTDMSTRRDKFGGGTSLPLNSDGYEDKQQQLRDERHKDWMVQQDKPRDPVYYRVGTPEEGFPGLGEYEKQRNDINLRRQKEYNEMLTKQRQVEQQKYEARRHSPPRPVQPQGPQMDYNLANEQARAEERKSYQDYMGKNQYSIYGPQKPIVDYEQNKILLSEERKREYNELLEKKAKEERYWAMRGRPVTPPGGLDIGNYDRQLKETAQQKKKEYKEMLDQQKNEQLKLRAMDHVADISPKYVRYRDQERPLVGSPRDINYYMQEQQKEHMYIRARQEPEMAVLDRNAHPSQYLANKPPPGPSYGRGRDEPNRQTPAFWNDGKEAQGPASFTSGVSGSNRSSANVPMAFKTESQNLGYGEAVYPVAGQIEANREPFNRDVLEEHRTHASLPPKSPEKAANPEWLRVPPKDNERPSDLGTPMAFKTDTYSRQPPPSLEHAYPVQSPPKLHSAPEQAFSRPPFSSEGQKNGYDHDVDGTFGRPRQSSDRPRSRRSHDADRRHSSSKKEDDAMLSNKISPRRMKNVLYTDSEEVNTKRREASKERQKEYNEFLKTKAEERRRHEEIKHHQQMNKPAEIVKNPHYSSDDYEKFQREIQRKQGEEYQDFLKKQKYTHPGRKHDFVDSARGPYDGLFHGLGNHGNRSDVLNKERQQEYNERLTQQYGKDRPSGRPNWVKETLPNDTDRGRSPMKTQPPADQYQQMLDEKRREEANRRRYDDPEYQDRLSRGRDGGDSGARYGY